MKIRSLIVAAVVMSASVVGAADVTLESLLTEMVDRTAITAFPSPAFTCKQASSYNRDSKSPTKNWFVNGDASQFVRDEMNGDRKEWVLMDEEGPGAIVRWWMTSAQFTTGRVFRIYLDGSETPTIVFPIQELVGGNALVDAPLSAIHARGHNFYLPIPYAKHCKVTVDKIEMSREGRLFYQINYRTYPAGTQVESFTMEGFRAQQANIARVQTILSDANPPMSNARKIEASGKIDSLSLSFDAAAPRGEGGAVANITLKCDAPEGELAQLFRSTLLEMQFDGQTTVLCPIGEFFGCGVGLNPYKSWYATVEKDGTLQSRWVMPYRRGGKLSLRSANGSPIPYNATVAIETIPLAWNDSRMYFHANWRQERSIKTIARDGTKDWEYIRLNGRGLFVGDVLSILNRDPMWWGEGDEKIYVDGEIFPSHFGTGTEDYYGYAWGDTTFFESPFIAQPRADGPKNYGRVTNLRVRLLDSIPFTKDFRFDMEVWHWKATEVDYAVATFWYGDPHTTTVDAPNADQVGIEASQPVTEGRSD